MDNNKLTDHISDPNLKKFYSMIRDMPFELFQVQDQVESTLMEPSLSEKKLALFYGIRKCLADIISDLSEHGEQNQMLYGNLDKSHFEKEQKKNDLKIKDLEDLGIKTNIFSEWESKYEKMFKEASDKLMDEFDV